ncbi:phage holin family protein [Arcanobacterium pinnipediorum]|uniref:Phage holin family protein n=1 Tax=Arcanobacterium pinnipediorum TaxID=1503041 RepID=A0ABY5AHP6_9ACTO|nr:phage holin family protein [Arcanobacterium pinnipediorum]USR79525.1 phage holin family protein [Arcanobacterium pinnipediorum]
MKFLVRILSNALALWVTTLLFNGFALLEPSIETQSNLDPQLRMIIALLVGGLILSFVNSFVRPIVKLFSLPFYILTLGLFFVIVNAGMLMLTSWISHQVGIGISVDTFTWAIVGGIVISVVNTAIEIILPAKRR